MTDELDKVLSEEDKFNILSDMVVTAKKRGAMQEELQEHLKKIVFDRVYPDGRPVTRESVWAQAAKMLHSIVPDKVLEQTTVGLEDGGELRIRLVLEAGGLDPRVTEADVLDMFSPGQLPAPGGVEEE